MKLLTNYSALAILGQWNPAIFSPEWIAKYVLPDEKELDVEIPAILNASLKVSNKKFSIYVANSRLQFELLDLDDATFDAIEDSSRKVTNSLRWSDLAGHD